AIGKVKEVHTWSSKKWGDLGRPPEKNDPVPAGLDWDLWLGGCAPRPYVMGCHIFDPVFEALALTSPISLRSEGPAPDKWNWSINARIHYVFPGTKFTEGKTVPVTWYDGDQRPPAEIQKLITPPPSAEKADAKKRK